MFIKRLVSLIFITAMSTTPFIISADQPKLALSEIQRKAEKFNVIIKVPEFEQKPEDIFLLVTNTINNANTGLEIICKRVTNEITFENTVQELDHVLYEPKVVANKLFLMKETSKIPQIRQAATDAIKLLQDWFVTIDYREDLYKAVKAVVDSKPKLAGEDAKLLEETYRDFLRAGMHLPQKERSEIEQLRKDLAKLCTDFDSNISSEKCPITFSKEELIGVPESFLNQEDIKTGKDEYTIYANITWHFTVIMENAKNEETRKRLQIARFNLAKEKNAMLLQKIVELRDLIATKLGYKSWADYVIEPYMAKTSSAAIKFLQDLKEGLQPGFDRELAAFRELKVSETGNTNATINIWDWRYYSNKLKQDKYKIDTEALRAYFQCDQVLNGMFRIFEKVFNIKIQEIEPPWKWSDDLRLCAISDATSEKPLGLMYLDLYPRDGKYNHFAQFSIIEGKLMPSGYYQRPTVALVCNFPPHSAEHPSLLSHQEVVTLFHEFGHALHSILTTARYSRFSGTSVARDFVEVPSQVLENWAWDKSVLDTFARDYRDPSKKIPAEVLDQLKKSKQCGIATFYRRQLAFGLLDLNLHTQVKYAKGPDCVDLSNRIISETFLPVPPSTAFVAYFGHLTGYDAGYYGYAWAEALAADLATVFENSKEGFMDTNTGSKLRNLIFAPGGSVDPNQLVENFLGRKPSQKPFLKTLGIESDLKK